MIYLQIMEINAGTEAKAYHHENNSADQFKLPGNNKQGYEDASRELTK